MRKKLKSNSGLTFVEMLCATAILFLLVLMMSTGMQMALASYRTHTGDAETQLLLNSLSDALSDKLRYCVVTELSSGGYMCTIGESEMDASNLNAIKAAENGRVVMLFQERVASGGYKPVEKLVGSEKKDRSELLPAGAYGLDGRYQVTEASVTNYGYTVGTQPVFTVTLKAKDTQTDISKETTLTVRCLNPVKKEGTSP